MTTMDTQLLMKLRERTGAPITACRQALLEADDDFNQALRTLQKKGLEVVQKKAEREAKEGRVEAYIHQNGKIGALVEVDCETDFVARNQEFKEFTHDLVLQIAASDPLYLSPEDVPPEVLEKQREMWLEEIRGQEKPPKIIESILQGKLEKWLEDVCFSRQPYIKNEDITVGELLQEKIAKFGENIKIKRFARFSL